MENALLSSTEGLKPGDVVQIATKLTDKVTGKDFWWRRFCAVTKVRSRWRIEVLHLKMHPDLDKDLRDINLNEALDAQVVTLLPPERMPQGVTAMLMKALHKGWVKIDGQAGLT